LKTTKLSLEKQLSIFILCTLLVAMSLMLFFSLYFYKKHFEEEKYQENKTMTQSILINENLKDYTPHGYIELRNTLILGLFSILLLASLVIIWRIRTLMQPLLCLTDFCKHLKEQSSTVPLCQANSSEVAALHEALVALINKNRYLCQSKVDLFKEIAHELKAPLAIMQARLSLLHEDKQYDLQKYEEETSLDISLMNSKLKELLFLKEIESDMQQGQTENICMMSQCKKMQERFIRLLQLKNLTMNANWQESFIIVTHEKVLQKVMQVIFENVFIHSKPDSTINVEVFSEQKRMLISNEINPDTSGYSSSHIGLKIIARLADKLHYEFETSNDGKYFTTSIKFIS